MNIIEFFNSPIGESLFVVFVTMISGLSVSLMSLMYRKRNTELHKKQTEVIKAVEEKAEVKKLELMKELLDKLPEGTNYNDLLYAVSSGPVEIRYIEDSAKKDEEIEYFEELIENYHNQALSQSSIQFWFSIIAATVGFILIIYMILSLKGGTNFEYVLRAIPGIMIDSVAALFFKQASETRRRATEFFDKLRKDKQITRSIAIANSIENSILKSAVKAQIALTMAGIEVSNLDIKEIINQTSRINVS